MNIKYLSIINPPRPPKNLLFFALCAFLVGWAFIAYACVNLLPLDPAALEAARVQTRVIEATLAGASARGLIIDPKYDRNITGMIGEAHSGLTSTLGSLPAKRTAASPDAAALLVRLLREANVGRGSLVAINASGSFPGFALAAVSACGALGADAVLVLSIGSSSWGANTPEYTVFDMFTAARERQAFPAGYPAEVAAVSPGGAQDQGLDLNRDDIEKVLKRVESSGVRVIRAGSLEESVQTRMAIYRARGEPDILLGIGGNYSNSGADPDWSNYSGLIPPWRNHKIAGTGLVQDFLRAGKPVLQILDIADLAVRYGVPFDPFPLLSPGTQAVYRNGNANPLFVVLPPLTSLGLYFFLRRKRGGK